MLDGLRSSGLLCVSNFECFFFFVVVVVSANDQAFALLSSIRRSSFCVQQTADPEFFRASFSLRLAGDEPDDPP